ncbi:MAG: YigZ family protein [Muribaculaceae bacterium]|nr:YigZ family protein [Muribaculaceae bacterium]
MASYQTIESESTAVFREKMSKFISFATPVSTVEDAKAVIATTTNKYHDARHVCWAYVIGADRSRYLSSDNGEPSGTAGKPILGQINSAGLTDIVICVVRYFGGIKLGTSGLIAAYRESARLAIEAATIITAHEMSRAEITFPYLAMNDVMRLLKMSPSAKIVDQQFDNTCRLTFTATSDEMAVLLPRVKALDGVT